MGTVVEALHPDADVVGCFEVTTAGNCGAMFIYGKAETGIPGMQNGETVTFRFSGESATATPEFLWSAGRAAHWVALAATSSLISVECYALDLDANPSEGGQVDADQESPVFRTASPASTWPAPRSNSGHPRVLVTVSTTGVGMPEGTPTPAPLSRTATAVCLPTLLSWSPIPSICL